VLSRARKALRKEFATRGGTLPAGGLVALAPWLDGLGWLDRLRRVAVRAATPAALGAASLGVLAGALVAPWSTAPETAPDVRTAVVALPAYEVAAARASIPPLPVAPPTATAVAVPTSATEAAPPAPPAPRAVLGTTGLNGACVDAAGATAGARLRATGPRPVLHLGPRCRTTPASPDRVVGSSDVDCTRPHDPVTRAPPRRRPMTPQDRPAA
jgi:hypothetical protein